MASVKACVPEGRKRRHHGAAVKDYSGSDWRKVFDVNVNGAFYCNRAAVRAMEKGGYGRIVNVASVAGKEGNPNASAYSASKAAVIVLTKSLGKETATTGIRVNCITPAAIKTLLFDQMTAQHIEFMLSKIPLGRFGTIEEATSLVCWLASEECSFSTGAGIRPLGWASDLLAGGCCMFAARTVCVNALWPRPARSIVKATSKRRQRPYGGNDDKQN